MKVLKTNIRKIFSRGKNNHGSVSYALPLRREDLGYLNLSPDNSDHRHVRYEYHDHKITISVVNGGGNRG